MRWALAAQAALVVVLAAGLVLVMPVQQATYETLSRPGAAAASGRAQLRIVFADDLTASELGALLQGVDGQIVRGPSPTGVYTIELPFTPAARERLGQVLVTLRSDPKVRLAEPVGPAPVQ
ncbi:MAG TPA: hypothetical protein VF059_02480 [Casimicrobiaceae bacterium]